MLEKLAATCKVTLPEAGMLTLKPLKVAEELANTTGPAIGLPLLRRLIPLIPLGAPVPLSDTVRLVKFTGVFPVLVNTTERTGTLEAPGNWLVFGGAGEPVEICTVAGVAVGVLEGEGVEVLVKVAVAKAIVTVAPVEGKPLKLTGCPFVPAPAVALN